ncbi:MAG: hypothetical protein GYB49_03240 [Alphaproteobacteria bacterium]|nr:hypothetical protein [Alphaproteobacteria bacterium]
MGHLRPGLLLASLFLAGCAQTAPLSHTATITQSDMRPATLADAEELCALVRTEYAFYESRRDTWEAACADIPDKVGSVASKAEQLQVLETLLDALHDPHASFGTNSGLSPRLVPSGADYWLTGDQVVAVRPGSAAAQAGLKVGERVIAINGRSLEEAMETRLQPKGVAYGPAQKAWALNAAAAGYRNEPRSVTVAREGGPDTLSLENNETPAPQEFVSAEMLPGRIGYIRLNNSLGDSDTVAAFDAAMAQLKGARGWVLDLRDTPGGGNTDVAEPILGHFLSEPANYQRILPMDEPAWIKQAAPHGRWTAEGPVVVLVGRWTGSMGEGLAIGFDGARRGDVFGSDMARLAGGVEDYTLSRTGIPIRLPAYSLAHVYGTPRHEWTPPHQVIADNGDGPDLALQAALDWLGEFSM